MARFAHRGGIHVDDDVSSLGQISLSDQMAGLADPATPTVRAVNLGRVILASPRTTSSSSKEGYHDEQDRSKDTQGGGISTSCLLPTKSPVKESHQPKPAH